MSPVGRDAANEQLNRQLAAARRAAQCASPHTPEGAVRRERVAKVEAAIQAAQPLGFRTVVAPTTTPGLPATPAEPRGPKGARVGDIVIADRSRWEVQAIDPDRREAVCRLLAGSHAVRRFRARAIERVERAPRDRGRRRAEGQLSLADAR